LSIYVLNLNVSGDGSIFFRRENKWL